MIMPAQTGDDTIKTETTPTPSASHLSAQSVSNTPTPPSWTPPKSPLPPHRLAKIANALGVATPLPAIQFPAMTLSPPFSRLNRSHTDLSDSLSLSSFRRSPTPSSPGAGYQSYAPTLSKFLLHIIPPTHLPHDTNEDDSQFTPFPSTVNGYHTQFRRGVLVPLYASLQLQLNAIAREYALPSTTGIILYLISSASNSGHSGISNVDAEADELGPRLSEEIWKHLWTRVMKAEQRDDQFASSPRLPPLPSSPTDAPLRPFLSNASPMANGLLPNPSIPNLPPATPTTPSTASDLRSFTKSAPPSILSNSDRDGQTETPDTSTGDESRANSLDLPGLSSNSIIPVLAKVEFDIDRRKAVWYDRWLKSRKVNHAKRSEGRKGSVNRQASTQEEGEQAVEGEQGEEKAKEKRKPISLLIGRKTASPVSFILSPADDKLQEDTHGATLSDKSSLVAELEVESNAEGPGYEQLSERDDGRLEEDEFKEADEDLDDESDEEFATELTARVMSVNARKDPLADVFGTDEETWAEMQDPSQRASRRKANHNVVELALNAADLAALPSPSQSEIENPEAREKENGIDEVQTLLQQVSSAKQRTEGEDQQDEPTSASSQIQVFPDRISSLSYRSMSSTTSLGNGGRKHIPAPLVLVPAKSTIQELDIPTEPSPLTSSNASVRLAYLRGESLDDAMSPGRLSIGEGEDEFDDDMRLRTPAEYERREAVIWDEDLELSTVEEFDEDDPNDRRRSQLMMKAQLDEIERTMASLSPRNFQAELEPQQKSPMGMTLSPNDSISRSPGMLNSAVFPPSPHSTEQHERASPIKQVNFANDPASEHRKSLSSKSIPRSPPKFTINRPPSSPPRPSNETENSTPQPLRPALKTPNSALSAESPIIPLSPDPFGRFSSDPASNSSAYWDNPPDTVHILPKNSATSRSQSRVSSRFSVDSSAGEEAKEAKAADKVPPKPSIVSVSSFRKFWRRGTKTPTATPSPTPSPSGPSGPSGTASTPTPGLNRRPSQDPPDLPPQTPISGQFNNQLLGGRPSQERELASNAAQRGDEPPKTPLSGQFPGSLGPPRSPPQPVIDHARSQPQLVLPDQAEEFAPGQPGFDLYAGPLIGRGPTSQPIHAAHMQRVRKNSALQGPEFDQEVPYPIHRSPSIPRAQLPSTTPPPTESAHQPQASMSNPYLATSASEPSMSPQPPPSPLVPEKPSLRKSILKSWKSSTSLSTTAQQQEAPAPPMPSRPSISVDRPPSVTGRPRKASLSHGSRTSVSAPVDLPPSPQIPQQFLQHGRRPSVRSRLTGSSIDSSQSLRLSASPNGDSGSLRRSVASSQSRDSFTSRPSFDVSQFEIVSPRPPISPPAHQSEHQH